MPEHLRPHQYHQYDYKGQGDVDYYEEKVIEYWESKRALEEYLSRLSKPELEKLLLTLNSIYARYGFRDYEQMKGEE